VFEGRWRDMGGLESLEGSLVCFMGFGRVFK